MRRLVVLAVFAAFVFAILVYSPAQAGPQAKVKLCHHNPHLTDHPPLAAFVIQVAAPAVHAHLAHGDCLALEDAVVGTECWCADDDALPGF